MDAIERRLRERGLPVTPMYRRAQERRDARQRATAARRNAARAWAAADRAQRAGDNDLFEELVERAEAYEASAEAQGIAAGDEPGAPRAEPDQVVRAAARFDDGRFAGRYEGAVTTGMTEKVDAGDAGQGQPTNEGSTWMLDLMDMSTRQGESGFAMLAVDVHSRFLMGALLRDKTLPSVLAGFEEILQIGGADKADKRGNELGAPTTIDTDYEKAWTRSPEWEEMMQQRGIQHRFKTSKYAVNNLAMIDEKTSA